MSSYPRRDRDKIAKQEGYKLEDSQMPNSRICEAQEKLTHSLFTQETSELSRGKLCTVTHSGGMISTRSRKQKALARD